MKELYIVKFNYKKDDGYWKIGKEVEIEVPYTFENEKDNHCKAGDIILKTYNEAKIICITYV